MSLKSRISSFSAVFFLSSVGAEAAFSPFFQHNQNVVSNLRASDPCLGAEHEKDCRDIKARTDRAMQKFVIINGSPKTCYAGLGSVDEGRVYLRSFSQVACDAPVDANSVRVNNYEAAKEAFKLGEVPHYLHLAQPFSLDEYDYEGLVGQFRMIGEAGNGEQIFFECASPLVLLNRNGLAYETSLACRAE